MQITISTCLFFLGEESYSGKEYGPETNPLFLAHTRGQSGIILSCFAFRVKSDCIFGRLTPPLVLSCEPEATNVPTIVDSKKSQMGLLTCVLITDILG